jgi:hypothetical protein
MEIRVSNAKNSTKNMFFAVLNWKGIQFSESHKFWGIWKKIFVFKILLVLPSLLP